VTPDTRTVKHLTLFYALIQAAEVFKPKQWVNENESRLNPMNFTRAISDDGMPLATNSCRRTKG